MRLLTAAKALREAQKTYMHLRDDPETDPAFKEEAGRCVAAAADELDWAIAHAEQIAPALTAIEGELRYQIKQTRNKDRPDMIENLSAGDTILAMNHCLAQANAAWYSGHGDHVEAAGFIRKLAALGVRFMNTFSAPRREGY